VLKYIINFIVYLV